jgi:hypothetical protein
VNGIKLTSWEEIAVCSDPLEFRSFESGNSVRNEFVSRSLSPEYLLRSSTCCIDRWARPRP